MSFIVMGVLIFLIIVVFMKYKSVYSVLVTITIITALTTAVLIWGALALSGQSTINFFYTVIGKLEFYILIAAWYIMDILCAAIIIRRYLEYKKINSVSRYDGPLS